MSALIDYEQLGKELVRELRGKRSCPALSRRAGYRSNVVYRWERGEAWPTAAQFLALCSVAQRDVAGSFTRFFQKTPAWLRRCDAASADAVTEFLRELRGKTPIVEVARGCGVNRFTLSRWMNGQSEPRLPDFLRLVDTLSRRLVDWVATLFDPSRLPSLTATWKRVQAARTLAYEKPLSHAVLRALELNDADPARNTLAWFERKLGLERTEIESCLAALRAAGLVGVRNGAYRRVHVPRVDTRADPIGARAAKITWTNEAVQRLERGDPGSFGFSLFSISRADLRRLRDLHLEYVRAMQSIIANSQSNECVALYCAQLLDLERGECNALSAEP